MSQVSLPMRIALVATLAFSAIWFVALRPKPVPVDDPTPAAPAAAQSAPGKAAEQAQAAVGASEQAAEKHESAAGAAGATESGNAPAATATKPSAAKPGATVDVRKAAGDKASKAVLRVLGDVANGKVAVLLFWDHRLSDDRAVHRAVTGLSRRGGKVAVHVAPIRKLAQYEQITRGVPVVTSPTVLVIDRAGHGRAVGGLSVPSELEELVGKALKVKP
ncbi:MAG TPA: hypothetical protein VGV67_11915 [Solirubrobacteraceae bacterium]|nr:hypothetical protein [Solirubrobacteraceae bacterium]